MTSYNGVIAPEPIVKHVADVANYVLGFDEVLPAGVVIETIDAPVVEVAEGTSATELAISNEQATTSAETDAWGAVVPAGQGVQVAAAGGTANVAYKVTLVVTVAGGAQFGGAFYVEVKD